MCCTMYMSFLSVPNYPRTSRPLSSLSHHRPLSLSPAPVPAPFSPLPLPPLLLLELERGPSFGTLARWQVLAREHSHLLQHLYPVQEG